MTREEALQAIKAKMDYYESDKRLRGALETLIPELAESEDERIRKLVVNRVGTATEMTESLRELLLAYLEKQKEQKSLNISAASEWLRKHVCSYMNSEYNEFHKCVEYDGSIDKERLINDFEEAMQKEQDECPEYCVRSHCMGCSIYEKQKEKPSIFPTGFGEVRWNPISSVQQKPAEWDELQADFRNINEAFENGKKEVIANPEKYGLCDCKPAEKLSQEEEEKFPKDIEKDATQFCFDKGFNITPHQAKEIATHYLMIGHNEGYLEGRKNAHIPARELGLPSSWDFQQEWSNEEIGHLHTLASYIKSKGYEDDGEFLEGVANKLKSFHPQPKQEWSEDDEDFINMLILHFNYLIHKGGDSVETYKSYIEKLKSFRPKPHTVSIKNANKFAELEYERGVKDGIQSEKNRQWKPSEEQMTALEECGECKRCIKELYEDLQKRYGTC